MINHLSCAKLRKVVFFAFAINVTIATSISACDKFTISLSKILNLINSNACINETSKKCNNKILWKLCGYKQKNKRIAGSNLQYIGNITQYSL